MPEPRDRWPAASHPGRGWTIPSVAYGDVIECGAHGPNDTDELPTRWYGLLDTYDGHLPRPAGGPTRRPLRPASRPTNLLVAHRYQPPVATATRTAKHRPRPRQLRPKTKHS